MEREVVTLRFIAVVLLGVTLLSPFILAQDFLALQGNVFNASGDALSTGNLTVEIYDTATGGTLVWNSSDDLIGVITGGEYDVLLGNNTGTNPLSLEFGRVYYMAVFINGELLNYSDGTNRTQFESSVGFLNESFLNFSTTFNFSETGATNIYFQNVTIEQNLTVTHWIHGLFDWVINSSGPSTNYLNFNGTTLTFDEAQLNATIDDRVSGDNSSWNESYADTLYQPIGISYNATYESTYNITYAGKGNTSSIYLYNDMLTIYFNESQLNATIDDRITSLDSDTQKNTTGEYVYNDTNTIYLNESQLNATIWTEGARLGFNSTYNATYAQWAYNHTLAAQTYTDTVIATVNTSNNIQQLGFNTTAQLDDHFLNEGGDDTSGTYNFNGSWAEGGLTITDGGSLYAQTIFVYNLTSLNATTLNTNASIVPNAPYNGTFDIGNSSLRWRYGNFTHDITLADRDVYRWLYNQTAAANSYTNTVVLANYTAIQSNFSVFSRHTDVNANYTVVQNNFSNYLRLTDQRFNETTYVDTRILANYTALISYTDTQIIANYTDTPWETSGNTIQNTTTSRVQIGDATTSADLNVSGTVFAHNFSGNSPIVFVNASDNENVRITEAGYVGIGTNTPYQLLDIAGQVNVTDQIDLYGSSPELFFTDTDGQSGWRIQADGGDFEFYGNDGTNEYITFGDGGELGIGVNNPSFFLHLNSSEANAVNLSNVFFLDGSTQRIGIGTNTPGAVFTVVSSASNAVNLSSTFYVDGSAQEVGIGETSPSAKLDVYRNTGVSTTLVEMIQDHGSGTGTTLYVRQDGTGDIVTFHNSTNEVFTLVDDGYVGIGDSTPDDVLDIYLGTSGSTAYRGIVLESPDNDVRPRINLGAGSFPVYIDQHPAQGDLFIRTTYADDDVSGSSGQILFETDGLTRAGFMQMGTFFVGLATSTGPNDQFFGNNTAFYVNATGDGSDDHSQSVAINATGSAFSAYLDGNLAVMNGDVGIGTDTPTFKTDIYSVATGTQKALNVTARGTSGATGDTHGIFVDSFADDPSGTGVVYGVHSTATTDTGGDDAVETYGGYFNGSGAYSNNYGVYAFSSGGATAYGTYSVGDDYGVYGTSSGTTARGVFGQETQSAYDAYGILGYRSGVSYGGYFSSSDPSGYASYSVGRLGTSSDLVANSNTRGTCGWETAGTAASTDYTCTNDRYLAGVRTGTQTGYDNVIIAVYCCEL